MAQQTLHSDYLEKLGLKADPFQPSIDPATDFISPVFDQHLQKASHLCRYGGQLLAIIGGDGSGKTFFLNKLSSELVDIPKSVFVDAKLAASADGILSAVIARLADQNNEVPEGVGAKLALLRSLLAAEMEPPLLLVDNADELSDQELGMLQSLMMAGPAAPPIRMVMTGAAPLVDRLDTLNALDVIVYDMELEPITAEQWLAYCDKRMQALGLEANDIVSGQEVQRAVVVADGNIHQVFDQLKSLLRTKAEAKEEANLKLGLPPGYLLGAVALVSCLVIVVLASEQLWRGASEGVDEVLPVIQSQKSTSLPEYDDLSGESLSASTTSKSLEEEPSLELESLSAKVVAEAGPLGAAEISEVEPVVQEPSSIAESPEDPVVIGGLDESLAQKSLGGDVQEGTAIALQSPDPIEPEGVVEHDQPTFADPIEVWAENDYVLQIMAATDKQALQDFISGQQNSQSLRIFNLSDANKSWFVVIEGQYPSLESARLGIQNLPKSQQRDGPWPRKVKEIKSLLKEDGE